MKPFAIGAVGGVGALLAAGWLGLQVQSAPLPPYTQPAAPLGSIGMPAGLPAPVERYLRTSLGDPIPSLDSAVLSGRGRLRVSGITFPARFRFTHVAGRAYRHYIEATCFGLPLLKVNESYREGRARLELPFGTVSNEPKVDQGANLALWGEQAFWLPSALIAEPSVRWESVDGATARLIVPFGSSEDQFTVTFDDATGLIRRMEALRFRSAGDAAKLSWTIEPLGWRTFDGIRLPSPVAVTWQDEGTPWLIMDVEDVAYNAEVSTYIVASGP